MSPVNSLFYKQKWSDIYPEMNVNREKMNINDASKMLNVTKVNQWDATILDNEILDLFKSQMRTIFRFLKPGIDEQWKPEIEALLKYALFYFTVYKNKPTPGMKMQNLVYRNESLFNTKNDAGQMHLPGDSLTHLQRYLHGVFNIGLQWGYSRFHRFALSNRWNEQPEDTIYRRLWNLSAQFHKVYLVLGLMNLIVFLNNGRYRTLLDRLLQTRLVHSTSTQPHRVVTFDYMNRQIVWDGLVDIVVFLVPLVNWSSLWQKCTSILPKQLLATDRNQNDGCGICMSDMPQTPYLTSCGHIFCYYCLKSSCMMDKSFRCPLCKEKFTSSHRLTNN